MLKTEHLEDYMVNKTGEDFSITFDTAGQRLLNHSVKLPLNLNKGYKGAYDRDGDEHRTVEVLLKYLIHKSPEGDLAKLRYFLSREQLSLQALNGARFVSRRGVLSRMAVGRQLGSKGDWIIACERRQGAVFIEEELSESKRHYNRTVSEADQRASYWGHKFEDYMILPPPSGSDGDGESSSNSASEKSDLRIVIKATLESTSNDCFKLLYSGEVDAIDKDGKYIEMKTQKSALDGYWFWKEKSLRWWLQSRLVGIEHLLVGIKNSGGFVTQLKEVTLSSLENSHWDGEKCLEFLAEAMKFLDEHVVEGGCFKVVCENGKMKASRREEGILSEEFKNHFNL